MVLKKLNTVLILLVFCVVALPGRAQKKSDKILVQEGKQFYIHKIEKSQSLYSISKLYNVSIEDLYDLNPELKAGPKVNQEIRIPLLGSPNTQTVSTNTSNIDTSKFITHKLLKGETIYSLCRRYNVTERQLVNLNPSIAQGLKEGQVIAIAEKPKKKISTKDSKSPAMVRENKSLQTDTVPPKLFSKPPKGKYTVALALPFRLEQSLEMDLTTLLRSGSEFPTVPALAVDFYLGYKKALDSLTGPGFEVNTLLYDVDDKDSAKLAKFGNDPKFKEHDFIFGPLYANGFKTIAKRAKELHIPIVSPITKENKILYNNTYISKTNPSLYTLMESLADYCLDSLMIGQTNLLLIAPADKDKKEASFVNAFKKYFIEKQKSMGKTINDTVRIVKGIEGVKRAYLPNVKNVIVNLSTNQVLIADFITQLAVFKNDKDIVLCGWESSSTNDNIDQEYLNELHYVFPYQYNLIDTSYNQALVANYQNIQNTSPSEYYFMGFDISYYYLSRLKALGPDFIHNLNSQTTELNFMRFEFYRPDYSTGFDNRGVFIYQYRNYKLYKTGWK